MNQLLLAEIYEIREYISRLSYTNTTLLLAGALATIWTANTVKTWISMYRYFKKKNLPYDTPLPLLGNGWSVMKKGPLDADDEAIKKHGKIVGWFDGPTPVILTTDLKFIKAVMIKDFSHFVNRNSQNILEGIPFPFNKGINNLRDEEWKNARALVSPTFSSGKLKEMSKLICEIADNFLQSLEKQVNENGLFDSKKYFGCFTLDVMNSCCFGIKTDSFNDPTNQFVAHVKNVFSFTFKSPAAILFVFAPSLFTFLVKRKIVSLLPANSLQFIIGYIIQVIQMRKEKKEKKNDFIQHMIDSEDNKVDDKKELEKNHDDEVDESKIKWGSLKRTVSNDEILGHSFILLATGYETTATTLSFVSYNLAMNPESQMKLQQEMDVVLEKHNGEISYESVNEMNYLEMVINETLRMYPPSFRLERLVSDKYEYNGIKMEQDLKWRVPVWTIHHDPEIYPEPFKFIPERFDEENKKTRESVAFIPFGTGPRNCVAMRFSIIEMKLLLTKILSKYTLVKSDQTPEKLELDKFAGLLKPLEPIVVKVERR